MRFERIGEDPTRFRPGGFKGAFLDIGEAQENDRKRALEGAHFLIGPDVEPCKEIGAPGVFDGKERLEHGEVERLAESARASDEGYLVARIPPLTNE